jgi:hypothetical protein
MKQVIETLEADDTLDEFIHKIALQITIARL